MAFLTSCICCSLLTGSIMIGVISTCLYLLSSALELWMILETSTTMPIPSYILAIGYLLMSILSATMLIGIRAKWSTVLLSWVLMMIIYIFPEAGLVLFMSIYHWNGETYGVLEMSLWLVRIFFNLCGIVCIQSLWSAWREERSIFKSLQELQSCGGVTGLSDHSSLGIPGHHKIRSSLRYHPGYNNPAFSASTSHLAGVGGNIKQQHMIKRSASSASQFVAASRLSLPNISMNNNNLMFPSHTYLKQGLSKNEFNPGGFHKTVSQYDLPSFGLDPDAPVFLGPGYGLGGLPVNIYRGNSRRDHLMSETVDNYRHRGDNMHRSDSVSMLSERYLTSTEYDTLSLDRRKYRAHSMGAINMGYTSDTGDNRTMGGRIGSKQSLGQISGVSDGPEKYRDFAL